MKNAMLLILCTLVTTHSFSQSLWLEDWDQNRFGTWTITGTPGVWEIGTPTTGPNAAYSGDSVAGTVLNASYPNNTSASLISPSFVVPPASSNPRLRFWHWFETYEPADNGKV